MSHPYSSLNEYNFWSKVVTTPAPGHIDPVVSKKRITPSEKIATMGSCFAQHLSKNIQNAGFNYYAPEQPSGDLGFSEAVKRNYNVFSARYGNIYTVKQALQLFDRAFGYIKLNENIWKRNDFFVDAFRPRIEPMGFSSKELLLRDRETHLTHVRDVFLNSDWLMFTLGLTEAWMSNEDGAIFPIAPGVFGGSYNEYKHQFVNFSIEQVINDLNNFISKIALVNSKMNILLTVSPVPLIATYEDRHVLVSTTVSKAILRVAADVIERQFDNVLYFPSFEIITSPANSGRYFRDDLRQVTDIGVNHVMRIFNKHFMEETSPSFNYDTITDCYNGAGGNNNEVICDEEEIERAIRDFGL